MSKKNQKYLHIGCGDNVLPKPFLNLDSRKRKGAKQGKAYPLKFKSNTFDLVYASHVLEHFKKKNVLNILKDWVRVLKPGGTLRISVPCFENLSKIYKIDKNIDNIIGPLMGGQTYKENFHFNIFNRKKLSLLMSQADLEAIHPWDYRRTCHSKFWDFSQATTHEMPISLNLEGRKKFNKKNHDDLDMYELKKLIFKLKKNKKKIKTLFKSIK